MCRPPVLEMQNNSNNAIGGNTIGLLDSFYLKACNFMCDHGGLGGAIASGLAVADHDRGIFSEEMQGLRALVIAQGPVSIVLPDIVSPFLDGCILGSRLRAHPEYLNGRAGHYADEVSTNQIRRNFFAGLATLGISETYQSPSVTGALVTVALIGLAGIGHHHSNKASNQLKKELEKIAAEAQ